MQPPDGATRHRLSPTTESAMTTCGEATRTIKRGDEDVTVA
jgi:hypothetical protein